MKLKEDKILGNDNITVTGLFTYPIKSCKGTSLTQAKIGIQGIENDRRFMVVEKSTGMFVAQRSDGKDGIGIKSMCQITPTIEKNDSFTVSAPGMESITIVPVLNFFSIGGMHRKKEVEIWGKKYDAISADPDTNAWFTKFLSRERPGEYELVRMHNEQVRRTKHGQSQLNFADAYPLLVISQESLDDLNKRIGENEPSPMNRFRPNIVISGGREYDEDRIDRMVISGVDLEGMKLCMRCAVIMTDQETGERGKEPMKTLMTYRQNPYPDKKGVVFGRNFNHLSVGTIKLDDKVEVKAYSQYGLCDKV